MVEVCQVVSNAVRQYFLNRMLGYHEVVGNAAWFSQKPEELGDSWISHD